jgi:hypothetical protein
MGSKLGADSHAAFVGGKLFPRTVKCAAITHKIEHITERHIRVRIAPPIEFALHVEDERGIYRAGHLSTSCWPTSSTVPLRHVNGFPVPGLLRGHSLLPARLKVASFIPSFEREAVARFFGSVVDLLPVLETDFTPYGIGLLATTDWAKSWCAIAGTPLGLLTPKKPGTPFARRPCRLHRRWWHPYSDEASDIGSIALLLTGSLTGPHRTAEVVLFPALTRSADLWLAGSSRFTSRICLPLHAVACRERGPPPRKVINSVFQTQLLSQTQTQGTDFQMELMQDLLVIRQQIWASHWIAKLRKPP